MKQTIFKDKYPLWSLQLQKDEIKFSTTNEIVDYFIKKIIAHPIATYITTFDHYKHTTSLEKHKIAPDIKDVKNIIFCFGKEILDTKVAAIRPRSIAVCELESSFVIEFLEAPNEKLHITMEEWAKSLKK